jgi:hypothetical protein
VNIIDASVQEKEVGAARKERDIIGHHWMDIIDESVWQIGGLGVWGALFLSILNARPTIARVSSCVCLASQ